jgi:hypothetical protein
MRSRHTQLLNLAPEVGQGDVIGRMNDGDRNALFQWEWLVGYLECAEIGKDRLFGFALQLLLQSLRRPNFSDVNLHDQTSIPGISVPLQSADQRNRRVGPERRISVDQAASEHQ